MEDLGEEESLWRRLRKLLSDDQLDPESASAVRRVLRPLDDGLDRGHVLFVEDEADALQGVLAQLLDLLADVAHDLKNEKIACSYARRYSMQMRF